MIAKSIKELNQCMNHLGCLMSLSSDQIINVK